MNNPATILYPMLANVLEIPEDEVAEAEMARTPNWNSLTHMELVFQLSAEFELGRLTPEEIMCLTSTQAILQFIKGRNGGA